MYSGTHGLFSAAQAVVIAWVNAIGSHWYFTPNTIDQPSQQTAWARHGGWDAGVQRFADADVMLFVGNNPGVSAFSREGGPPYANAFKYLRDAKPARHEDHRRSTRAAPSWRAAPTCTCR